MKRFNKTNGMYALLIAVAAMIGITIYGSCSADEDFWGFDNEYASSENTRSEVKEASGYLKLSTYDFTKWTYEDHVIIQEALTRMRSSKVLIHEGAKIIVKKDAKASNLNMAEELFTFIKDASGDGYDVMRENNAGQSNKKKNISRRKTRNPEFFGSHNSTQQDYFGHAIAHCLNLDIDSVNNKIQTNVYFSYPEEALPGGIIPQAFNEFNNIKSFVQQGEFFPAGTQLPCPIPGIVFTPGEALNGELVYFDGIFFDLIGYSALENVLRLYPLSDRFCFPPALVDSTHFAYFK